MEKKVFLDVYSPELIEEEQVIWSAYREKGFFRKRKVWEAMVTNLRIFEYDWEKRKMIAFCLLKDAEIIVEKTWRVRRSAWAGPIIYRRGLGGYGGFSQSTYVTVGIVTIVANGKVITRWEIEDPRGFKKLVDTVKKQMKKNFRITFHLEEE